MRTILFSVTLMCLTSSALSSGPFRRMFKDHGGLNPPADSIVGDPLFITPYLEAGKIKEVRALSRVTAGHRYAKSYSGFFTVNKKYDSNLFFWFFPAKKSPLLEPVVVWLQGGPGGSSLFGLFAEHGPFNVNSKGQLVRRNITWIENSNVIYIDNPVGTGFSFTNNSNGYAQDQTDVGRDLYEAMRQFYIMFPELKRNSLFITGESYAGKYVPALTYTIHTNNKNSVDKMKLKGMAIGDGLCDPVTMTNYGDFLYQIGLIDEKAQDVFHTQSQLAISYIKQKKWLKAFEVFDNLLNGDTTGGKSYFKNTTGLDFYYNYLYDKEPADMDYWMDYINKPLTRKSLHVGNLTFNDGSVVESHLEEDIMKSVKPWIQEILDNDYKVMFYNGQLDIIIAYPLTENFLNSMEWKYAQKYRDSPRYIWRVGDKVAGYVREVPNMVQVMVRNAGHILPYDQPEWAFDMMTRFTHGKGFKTN